MKTNKILLAVVVALVVGMVGVCSAAVVTNLTAGSVGASYSARDSGSSYVVPFRYDARISGNAMSATGDSVIVVNVLSNSSVRQVRYAVTVSNGSACTFGITDTANASQYVATVTGTALVSPTTSGTLVERFYASNNTVRLWFDTAATGLVVEGSVEIIDMTIP